MRVRICQIRRAVGLLVLALTVIWVTPASSTAMHRGSVKNGRILFQRYVGDIQQLFTIKPDGKGIRQVTSGSQTSEYGNWSPKGSRIVFDRSPAPTGNVLGVIYRMNADGSKVVPLTGDFSASGRFTEAPAWSPDGRQIAFHLYTLAGPYTDGIWVMNRDGSNLRQVTKGPGLAGAGPTDCACDSDPRFSPDGRRIAFDREPNAVQAAVFVVNVDGSGLRRLTPWRIDAGDPKWSPDGSRLVYASYLDPHPGKSSNLYTIRPDGTRRSKLTHNRGGNGNSAYPAWSPDGKLIVFARNRLALVSHSRNELYIMPANGGRAKRLTFLKRYDAAKPDWGIAR